MKLTFRNPQARLFFLFVGATLLATLSQDIFLEPYGATVFAQTGSYLAAFGTVFGLEVLAALLGLGLLSRINVSVFQAGQRCVDEESLVVATR